MRLKNVRNSVWAVLLVTTICAVTPWAGEELIDLRLSSLTRLVVPADTIPIGFGLGGNFPIILTVEGGVGVLEVRYDAKAAARWDDESVLIDSNIPIKVSWDHPDTSLTAGYIGWRQELPFVPAVEIDFDTLFHSGQIWSQLDPNYPFTGIEQIPIRTPVPLQFSWDSLVTIPVAVTNPVSLGTPFTPFNATLVDTVSFAERIRPYPCLIVDVGASLAVELSLTLASDSLCVRYTPSGDDFPCWTLTDNLQCIVTPLDTVFINAPTNCQGYSGFPVTLCPVVSKGGYSATLNLRVLDASLSLIYNCGGVDSTISFASSGATYTLLDQQARLATARDDAIFPIPFELSDITFAQPTAGSHCAAQSICQISWANIDTQFLGCCTSFEADLSYVGIAADSSIACEGSIVTGYSFTGTSGSYSWSVPSAGCFDGSTRIFISGRFRCVGQNTMVAQAYSDTFYVDP
jgi:hypothetical protein